MDAAEDALLRILYSQVDLITDKAAFYDRYGFYLEEYLSNRAIFALLCRDHAERIERWVKRSGIAKTVGGSVNIISGGAAIAGIILAPFSAGLSLVLTVGGIAGGIAGASTNIIADLAKDRNIRADINKIQAALTRFERQESVIFGLLQQVQNNFNRLRQLKRRAPSKSGTAFRGVTSTLGVGWKAKKLEESVRASIKFAEFSKKASAATSSAGCIKNVGAAASSIADEVAAPGFRTLITAGSTTAKLLSGTLAAVGIAMGIWDIYSAVKDIEGSEISDAYRRFADEYNDYTENLISGIERLSEMI